MLPSQRRAELSRLPSARRAEISRQYFDNRCVCVRSSSVLEQDKRELKKMGVNRQLYSCVVKMLPSSRTRCWPLERPLNLSTCCPRPHAPTPPLPQLSLAKSIRRRRCGSTAARRWPIQPRRCRRGREEEAQPRRCRRGRKEEALRRLHPLKDHRGADDVRGRPGLIGLRERWGRGQQAQPRARRVVAPVDQQRVLSLARARRPVSLHGHAGLRQRVQRRRLPGVDAVGGLSPVQVVSARLGGRPDLGNAVLAGRYRARSEGIDMYVHGA